MSADRRGKNVMLWKKCPFLYGSVTWLKIQLQTLAYKRQRESKKEELVEKRKLRRRPKGKALMLYIYIKKELSLNWRNNIFQPTERKNSDIWGGSACLTVCTCMWQPEFPAHGNQNLWNGRRGLVWICLLLLLLNSKLSASPIQLVAIHYLMKKCEKTTIKTMFKGYVECISHMNLSLPFTEVFFNI